MLGQIVCGNIREEAQEIKRLLSGKDIDVDETVICELLQSLDPNHEANRMEYIIDMITGNQNFDSQASSGEVEQSIEIQSQSSIEILSDFDRLSKQDVYNSSIGSSTIDISGNGRDSKDDRDFEDDKDSEDDRDYYYSRGYFFPCLFSPNYSFNDDCSATDLPRTNLLSMILSKNMKQKDCLAIDLSRPATFSGTIVDTAAETSNISNNSSIVKPHVKVDQSEIEFLEAEIELLNENNNNDVCMKSATCEKSRFSESPKPGCSKDSDDSFQNCEEYKNCSCCDSNELQIDAKQIHTLLPNIDYDLIYKTLCNNQLAKNRIELTLWDLLQKERPSPQLAHKRKYVNYEIHSMKNKRNFDILPEKETTDTEIEEKKQACTENKTKTIDVELKNREPMLLINETDKMETDITEDTTINDNMNDTNDTSNTHNDINNTDDDRNNDEANNINNDTSNTNNDANNTYDDANNINNKTNNEPINVTLTNMICLNTNRLTDVNMSADDSEKLDPPENNSKNKELSVQLTINSAVKCKTKMENAHSATTSTCMPSTSTLNTRQNIAMPLLRPARFTVTGGSLPRQFPVLRPPKFKRLSMNHEQIEPKDLSTKAKVEVRREKLNNEAVSITGPSFVKMSKQVNVQANNALLARTQTEMATFNKILNRHLRKDHNYEENSNFIRQINMIVHGVHNKEEQIEKEDFMSSIGMETNKEKKNSSSNGEIILNEKARKIYYRLIPMFPSVNTLYIKQLCQRHLTEARSDKDESVLLQTLVEYLLEHGQKYPITKKPEPLPLENNSNTYTLNEQYADLLGIFPEADPTHLRKVAEENYKDPEKIKEYVQSQLENPTYPTRAQALARKKITDQQKQYTSDFKIEQFLELFPDPFSYFENASRQCKFNPHAVDFLKQYFSKIRVNTLLYTYTEHQHNLSLTAKALEALSPDMKSKRAHNKVMLTEDIPLLQECCFIQHKAALKKYLTELKDKEEKEFQELKARNELIECQCCYDNECMPSKCSTCDNGHVFCNSCIVRSTELILANGKTHVDCLLNCGNEFSLAVLQQILPPTKFSILLCKRQEAEVMAAGLEGLVSCPFCHFASIPPPEDKVFRCLNPNCMKESCRLCKELNHVPLKCNEMKSDVARLYLEEKMTEALIRKCYKCGRTFFKEEGCNKMTCLCGAQMCYICDKPVFDYKHFQGQGVQDSNLCPLWSDDRRMNAESVIKVCHETLKHIKQKNPQVDINVAALLPKLPPKSKGPHEDIGFAHAMPAHAERVVRHNP